MFFRRRRAAEAFSDAWGSRRRATDDEVRELVALADRLGRSARAEPAPQFREELRARLLAAAPATMVAAPPERLLAPRTSTPARRRAKWAGAVAAAAIALVGSVNASAGAIPGDVLYPVKMGTERVERTLAGDDAALGQVFLTQATTRLDEAETLSGQRATNARTRVSSALDAFSASAERGAALLLGDPRGQVDESHASTVATFTSSSTERITALLGRLSPADRASAERAVQTLAGLGADVATACPACVDDAQHVAESVDALLSQVQRTLVDAPPIDGAPSASEQPPAAPREDARDAPDTTPSAPPTEPPAPPPAENKPIIALPEATAPKDLGDVVAPVVGIVLGDDRQEGLVPSVLGVLGLRR